MEDKTEAMRNMHVAQDELWKHRLACPTCSTTCSALRYCGTGKDLNAKVQKAIDRFLEVLDGTDAHIWEAKR